MYTVLARKWRPQHFDQAYGQEHVLTTLRNAIAMDRVAHAYLFSGPRGVGKTSVARILAKALNCVEGPTVNPCGICRHCTEIMLGQSLDVIEIDGASNRRIDDIREVEDHMKFTPVDGHYKIYIIDEVHMLTKEAFNALLKTLEEPPAHIKFIFATTEPDKIPDTIVSRCQHFAFKRVSILDIVANLEMIAKAEGISCDRHVLFDVARAAEGSLRDAQSLMDQVISFCGPKVRQEDLVLILGSVGLRDIANFVEHVVAKDYEYCLNAIQQMLNNGKDLVRFMQMIMQYVRDVLVVKVSGKQGASLVEMNEDEVAQAQQLADAVSLESLMYMVQLLLQAEPLVRGSAHPRIPFEITVIKMIHASDLTSLRDLLAYCREPHATHVLKPAQNSGANPIAKPEKPEVVKKEMPQLAAVAVSGEQGLWGQFVHEVKKEKLPLSTALQKAWSFDVAEGVGTIVFAPEESFCAQQVERSLPYLADLWQRWRKETLRFRVAYREDAKARVVVKAVEAAPKASHKDILEDPAVKSLLQAFDGKVKDIVHE